MTVGCLPVGSGSDQESVATPDKARRTELRWRDELGSGSAAKAGFSVGASFQPGAKSLGWKNLAGDPVSREEAGRGTEWMDIIATSPGVLGCCCRGDADPAIGYGWNSLRSDGLRPYASSAGTAKLVD